MEAVKENNCVCNEKVLNIYIVYNLSNASNTFHPRLSNCLFGSVKVTKKSSDFNGRGLTVMVLPFILTMYLHTQKETLGTMLLFLV